MKNLVRVMILAFVVLGMAGCGSGSGSAASTGSTTGTNSSPVVLAAGTTYTLPANTTVMVPSGTVITSTSNNTITINGTDDIVSTQAGSVIAVPSTATGTANNTVTDTSTTGNISATSLAVTALAGSETTNLTPIDGTGSAAIFWGGGHLAINAEGNIVVSDRGALRLVTQAGVVTTFPSADQSVDWEGIAIDSNGNIFGSGNQVVASDTFAASINKLTATGLQSYFPDWATSSSNQSVSVGWGGMAIDSSGNLFLASSYSNQILKFSPAGTWSVLAGSGATGNIDGTGASASFNLDSLSEIAIDSGSNLYVNSNGTIRKITSSGVVTTVAAEVGSDTGAIAVDGNENIYTAGFGLIYRISQSGTITTFNFPNTSDSITSLATDSEGNLYAGTRGIGAQIFKISF